MKKLERILIYSILAVLVFYVFLVNSNVESKDTIYEEIKVKNLIVVDSLGREAIRLTTNTNGGTIYFFDKAGKNPIGLSINDSGYARIIIYDKTGFHVIK